MLRIPNRFDNAGLLSTSTFPTLTFGPSSFAISSSTGAIIRQGPHQVAQKSTSTGTFEALTVLSKLVSSRWITDAVAIKTLKVCAGIRSVETWSTKRNQHLYNKRNHGKSEQQAHQRYDQRIPLARNRLRHQDVHSA